MASVSNVPFNADRWAKIVPLLTLDVVRPLFPAIGLELSDAAAFQQIVRQVIVTARKDFARSSDAAAIAPERLAESILESLDPASAVGLTRWISDIFHGEPSANAELRVWMNVLRHCRRNESHWRRLFATSARARDALEMFVRALNIDDFESRYVELTARPLSDWDLHMYAVHFFDDDDLEGTPNGPYLWLAPTVRDYRGRQFFRWLSGTLSDAERLTFVHEANGVARDEALTSNPLPDPWRFGDAI